MSSVESEIKKQYAKLFKKHHWRHMKSVAELYLETASKLRTGHLIPKELKLLFRNIQKRLFLGIACEILLKSYYLKEGFCINKPKQGCQLLERFPYSLEHANQDDFEINNTYSFNQLIDGLKYVHKFKDHNALVRGLKIAKVFRNKEGHIAVFWHDFDPRNYLDISNSLKILYSEGFKEELKLKISIKRNEKSEFEIKKLNSNKKKILTCDQKLGG